MIKLLDILNEGPIERSYRQYKFVQGKESELSKLLSKYPKLIDYIKKNPEDIGIDKIKATISVPDPVANLIINKLKDAGALVPKDGTNKSATSDMSADDYFKEGKKKDQDGDGDVDSDDWKISRDKAIKANLKEGDHEVAMAVSSLEAIAEAIVELRQKLGNVERNIPGWIQDHIAKAENYIEQAAQGFHELKNDE